MKILHYLGTNAVGGVASIVHYLAKYHRQQGVQVDLMSTYHNPYLIDRTGKFESLGCRVFTSPTDRRYSPRQLSQLLSAMRDYDIIHVHQFPQQLWGALSVLVGQRKGRPKVITTEHSTFNNRRRHHILKYYDRWMYSLYDHIVCISDATQQQLTSWLGEGFLSDRISTITNGIDYAHFSSADLIVPQGITLDSKIKYIGWVGRMEEPKTPVTLLKALHRLPEECHAIFMGDGALKDECIKYITEHNLWGRVHLLGNLNDVSGTIKCCQVGVLSTDWDGFGLAAAEYMASGIPALVSDVPGLKQVVDHKDLVFTQRDDAELADKLRHLLYNQDFYREATNHCTNHVKQFSAKRMSDEYLDLYRNLLK